MLRTFAALASALFIFATGAVSAYELNIDEQALAEDCPLGEFDGENRACQVRTLQGKLKSARQENERLRRALAQLRCEYARRNVDQALAEFSVAVLKRDLEAAENAFELRYEAEKNIEQACR